MNDLKQKKLLILAHSYNSFIKDQVEVIAQQFFEVFVLVRYNPIAELWRFLPVNSLKNFSKTTKFDLKDTPSNVRVIPVYVLYAPFEFEYKKLGERHYKAVKRIIRKNSIDFDLIHAHFIWSAGYVGAKLKQLYNIPLVITAHGYDIYDLPFRDDDWESKIEYVLNQADHVITVSNSNLDCISKLKVQTPTSVIPNGYREELFYPQDKFGCRKQLGLPIEAKIILSVGNLVPVKGHKYLIDAMAKVVKQNKNVLCLIIGSGISRYKLKRQIRRLGLQQKVLLLERKPHNKIPLWMNACDLFVLPSLAEGNPTVLVECLATGTSFIGTKIGGIPEIVSSVDYGLLCEPSDSNALADNILIAFERNWEERNILDHSRSFTWENISKQIADVYSDVIKNKY